jgi:Family of unknown function (DUF6481)
MRGYKEPTFQERTAAAARARNKALEKLKSRPVPTAEELERRAAAQAAKDAAEAERRAARKLEREAEAVAREAGRLAAEQAAKDAAEAAAAAKVQAEADAKAARDARYAARKGKR